MKLLTVAKQQLPAGPESRRFAMAGRTFSLTGYNPVMVYFGPVILSWRHTAQKKRGLQDIKILNNEHKEHLGFLYLFNLNLYSCNGFTNLFLCAGNHFLIFGWKSFFSCFTFTALLFNVVL